MDCHPPGLRPTVLGVDTSKNTADAKRIKSWPRYQRAAAAPDIHSRIERHVKVSGSGCWEWQSALSPYPIITVHNKTLLAHRLALLVYSGDYDPTCDVDHLCKNTMCVNPSHLEAVSHAENVRRGDSKLRGQLPACGNGHLYEEVGYIMALSNGRQYRQCNACTRDVQKRRVERRLPTPEKNHCKNGHEYTLDNTGKTHRGARRCRTCYRVAYAKRRESLLATG